MCKEHATITSRTSHDYEIQLRFEKPLLSISLDPENSSKEEIILVSSFLDMMISWLYFVISYSKARNSETLSKVTTLLPIKE